MEDLKTRCNDLDVDTLIATAEAVAADPALGIAQFRVATRWTGGTRSQSTVESFALGGETIARRFSIVADEPLELLGSNTAPNPQELLMAAVNACMTVGYVANAALLGIALTQLEIEMHGTLDLRGFLGLSDTVPAGYRALDYTVRIAGDGTPAQFAAIHDTVMRTSPNFFNMARPIAMNGRLEVG